MGKLECGNLMRAAGMTCMAFCIENVALAQSPPSSGYVSNSHFLQYGVAIASENVALAGDICPSKANAPCIIGSGLGATIRAGYRLRGPWYLVQHMNLRTTSFLIC